MSDGIFEYAGYAVSGDAAAICTALDRLSGVLIDANRRAEAITEKLQAIAQELHRIEDGLPMAGRGI